MSSQQSFLTVEDQAFRALLKAGFPSLELPNRRSIKAHIEELCGEKEKQLISYLANINSKVWCVRGYVGSVNGF